MPRTKDEANGETGCYFHDRVEEDRLLAMWDSTRETEKAMKILVASLDVKMEKLVAHLIERSETHMIPVVVLKWIVIFLLVFNFAFIFGIPATEKLANRASTFLGSHDSSE